MAKFNEKYLLSVGKDDLNRMNMLASIYMPYCTDFLLENGLKAGLKVADVGCGPGYVSLWLAEQVGITGKVVGIDNSDEQLAILDKQILEKKAQHIFTYKADIYELDEIEERFDLVFCRFTLVHLAQPLVALEKMSSLLKPGGFLIIAELDNSTWFSYPENDALRQDTELLCGVGTNKGSDFSIGPKLYDYLRQLNFNSIHVKIAQPVLCGNNREYLILKCKAWANTYRELGLIAQTDLENLIKHLHDLVHNDNYLLAGAKMYLTGGRK